MYKIDYKGQQFAFEDSRTGNQASEQYAEGEHVVLCYRMVATDTNYYFYLDGTEYNPGYEDGKGYIIDFIMPGHDITLYCTWHNSSMQILEK